jgi:hypothetical protein
MHSVTILSVPVAQQPNSGLGRLILQVPIPHTIRHTHPVGLLWTSDQFVAEAVTFANTQHSQETDIHAPAGFETIIPASASQRPQTHASDRAATGIGSVTIHYIKKGKKKGKGKAVPLQAWTGPEGSRRSRLPDF